MIDVHYASLTSQGVQHRVFYLDGHPSRYQPRPTGLFTRVESSQTNLNNYFVKITERTLTTQAKSQEDLIRLIENLTAKENVTRAFELSPATDG